MIKEFQEVRDWKSIRGIGGDSSEDMFYRLQSQYQRVMQECIEIHDAMVKDDHEEFMDAIGDTIVTLINLADIKGVKAEDCLAQAFNVIKLRKGLTSEYGDFVRYAKLPEELKAVCDEKQGSPGEQYFSENLLAIDALDPEDFKA